MEKRRDKNWTRLNSVDLTTKSRMSWLATWLERVNNEFSEVHFKKLLYFYLVLLICCKLEESVKNEENKLLLLKCYDIKMVKLPW